MYDFLKNISENNGWGWVYGRSDYQNLENDMEAEKVYLFCDPIITDSKFSDAGNESLFYSGRFMMLLSSDIDEGYEDKYQHYIKPIINSQLKKLKDEFACSDYQITVFQTIEVININDVNGDGVLVNYNASLID
ncbi:MAG: hypothetical protein DI539_09440 [Flavobacterium psychrophilum]|nr:MAG: hypothetical protein DI539_09440 [Flavobacterium psychrophilum]